MGCQIEIILVHHGLKKITYEVDFQFVFTQNFFYSSKKLLLNMLRLVAFFFIDLKTVNYIYSTKWNQH